MASVEVYQVWEVYSPQQDQWSRAVVAEVSSHRVVLRYEGTLELVFVSADELASRPERFRQVVVE